MAEERVKTDPDYVPALMLLGELYNSQKRSEDSIKIYERILVISRITRRRRFFWDSSMHRWKACESDGYSRTARKSPLPTTSWRFITSAPSISTKET